MKKFLYLAIALVLMCLLALSACDVNLHLSPDGGEGTETTTEALTQEDNLGKDTEATVEETDDPADETDGETTIIDATETESETVTEIETVIENETESETEVIEYDCDAGIHSFGEWRTVTAATCRRAGKAKRTCTLCALSETKTIEKAEHTPTSVAAVAPTCGKTGLTEGSRCSVCDKIFVAQIPIAASGSHTPGQEIGGIVYCSICDMKLEDNRTFTITFKLGTQILKTECLKPGASITKPTAGNNKWYIWSESIPEVMPEKNITVSAVAIGGDAWANTTWEYNFNGKLSIHGKGNMSYFSEESQPWAEYKSEITSLEFDSAITGIGKYAFFGCTSLTKVVIPDSIITIGDYAFSNCESIRELTIGAGVTTIGTGAFVSSYNLECLTMRGRLQWQVKIENYSSDITFRSDNKYKNAAIFKEYCSGKFTAY